MVFFAYATSSLSLVNRAKRGVYVFWPDYWDVLSVSDRSEAVSGFLPPQASGRASDPKRHVVNLYFRFRSARVDNPRGRDCLPAGFHCWVWHLMMHYLAQFSPGVLC